MVRWAAGVPVEYSVTVLLLVGIYPPIEIRIKAKILADLTDDVILKSSLVKIWTIKAVQLLSLLHNK